MEPSELERVARQIRLRDLQAVYEAGAGHIGGEMSVIDLLTALYFRVLRIWPDQPKHPDRDRFVLSKGHTACALYVATGSPCPRGPVLVSTPGTLLQFGWPFSRECGFRKVEISSSGINPRLASAT